MAFILAKTACLGLVRDEALLVAILDNVEAELTLAAAIDALGGQMALSVAYALAQAVALPFSDSGEDGEHHLRHAVADHSPQAIDHVKADTVAFELLEHSQRVAGVTEGAIELGGDNDVALARSLDEALALRAV